MWAESVMIKTWCTLISWAMSDPCRTQTTKILLLSRRQTKNSIQQRWATNVITFWNLTLARIHILWSKAVHDTNEQEGVIGLSNFESSIGQIKWDTQIEVMMSCHISRKGSRDISSPPVKRRKSTSPSKRRPSCSSRKRRAASLKVKQAEKEYLLKYSSRYCPFWWVDCERWWGP